VDDLTGPLDRLVDAIDDLVEVGGSHPLFEGSFEPGDRLDAVRLVEGRGGDGVLAVVPLPGVPAPPRSTSTTVSPLTPGRTSRVSATHSLRGLWM